MRYQVGIKIYNSFIVEADSEEEAEEIVRELSIESTLRDSDYNITYVDKVRDIPKEMCNDLLRTINGRVICDDEHGNSL